MYRVFLIGSEKPGRVHILIENYPDRGNGRSKSVGSHNAEDRGTTAADDGARRRDESPKIGARSSCEARSVLINIPCQHK